MLKDTAGSSDAITTIPAILARGSNQSKLAISLGISRGTLRKYLNDIDATHHVVVDGVFYSRPGYVESKHVQAS